MKYTRKVDAVPTRFDPESGIPMGASGASVFFLASGISTMYSVHALAPFKARRDLSIYADRFNISARLRNGRRPSCIHPERVLALAGRAHRRKLSVNVNVIPRLIPDTRLRRALRAIVYSGFAPRIIDNTTDARLPSGY